MTRPGKFFILLLLILINPTIIFSQAGNADTIPQFKTIVAGGEYKASGLHNFFWGSNYRNLWTTPVTVKTLNLDTAYGGLTIFKADDGEVKILYLKNVEGKQYVLTSVNKTPGKLLRAQLRGTYAEDWVNDAVSITNPYAAATIPGLIPVENVYTTDVIYVYVPKQPALNTYNDAYGNNFYKLEQVNIKQNNATSNTENAIETAQLLNILNNNTNCSIDKNALIRERLFDMFVNDWNRGEDKWRWQKTVQGSKQVYMPIPADRDAAYTRYNGKFTKLGFQITHASLIQSFKTDLKNVNSFNFRAKDLDRRLLNEATLSDWQTVAADLQKSLTNELIEEAVRRLPKEIYPLTGNEIVTKLKARRDHLVEWATQYYHFLSAEVEIPGTYQNEEFDVEYISDTTVVHVFSLNGNEKNSTPYYSRKFIPAETKEIRLFGLYGADKYSIKGNTDNAIKLMIITGAGKDSIVHSLPANNKDKNVVVYGQNIATDSSSDLKIITDTSYKSYRYNWFDYDKKGFFPFMFYSYEDRLYIGLGYRRRHYAWGKMPFASNQLVDFHYSLLENAFSVSYKAIFPKLIAKSDLTLYTNYDDVRWTYFFGLGNDTKFNHDNKLKYYTTRTRHWIVQPALVRNFGRSTVSVFGSLSGVKVIDDTARFLNKVYEPDKSVYDWQNFAGAGVSYSFQDLNDALVPTKGVFFNTTVSGAQNLKQSAVHYLDFKGAANFYIPLSSKFSLNLRAGAETVTGNPEFYQYPSIGGVILRGVVRDRFKGKTVLYNTNDLRFISPVHTHLFAGKAGVLVFVDNGRVWLPDEESNTWHVAYGAGIILAPFKIAYADFNYGRSKNEGTFQVRVTFSIP